MSSISSSSPNLYAFFQSLSNTASAQTQSTDPAGSTSATDSTTSPTQTHHHHHHRADNDGDSSGSSSQQLFSQIQSAVTSALQNAANDPGADPNTLVQNAITSVLNGDNSTDSTSSTNPSATNPNPANNASDSRSAFFQTLQSYGIDPKQFHSDFLNAVKSSQQSGDASNNPFQSFPPGLAVDTAA